MLPGHRERGMAQRYEYTFVRMGRGWFGVKRAALDDYQDVVRQYARDGWRLVQVLAPGVGVYGETKYLDLIFEREVQ